MESEPATERGNKLIREFMGHGYQGIRLSYDRLWDCLMPVVSKIHALVNDGHKVISSEAWIWCAIMDALVAVDINNTHKYVCQYIKYHNQNNLTNGK